jgi:hypothetical protein
LAGSAPLSIAKVAPAFAANAIAPDPAPALLPSASVPASIATPPAKVLAASSASVPAPSSVSRPAPALLPVPPEPD